MYKKCLHNTEKLQMMKELIIQDIYVQDFVMFVNFVFLLIEILIKKIMHAMGVIIY